MANIEHSLASIQSLDKVLVDLVGLAKNGISFNNISQLFGLLADLKAFADNAPQSVPELKDIDPSEAGQLAAAGFLLFKDVMAASAKV